MREEARCYLVWKLVVGNEAVGLEKCRTECEMELETARIHSKEEKARIQA